MQNNFRKTYIIWFLVLVLSSIILRLGTVIGYIAISESFAALLTIISKAGFVILTIWYGLKIGIKKAWAWVLGLATLLPLMPWISAVILLRRKPQKI